MFSSIGWGEIFTILIIGLIVIGPERLPGVLEDIRAGLIAARRAIDNVKKELNDEIGSEFAEFAQPIGELAKLRAMGPKAALAKTLFDDDENFLDGFDPKKFMQSQPTAGEMQRQRAEQHNATLAQAAAETVRVERPVVDNPVVQAAARDDEPRLTDLVAQSTENAAQDAGAGSATVLGDENDYRNAWKKRQAEQAQAQQAGPAPGSAHYFDDVT